MLSRLKRRKGVTDLLELVICVGLFGMILVLLLTLMAHINQWSSEAYRATETERDMDFIFQLFVADVKSASNVDLIEDGIQLTTDDEPVIYYVGGEGRRKTLYRNNERLAENITAFSFSVQESVRMYIYFVDGTEIDLTITR